MSTTGRRGGKALVLVGHGSHLSPDSGQPVYEHARRIRAAGLFDEVVEVFWKEEPNLRDGLDLVESEDVWIVPLFLAEGYFTREVIPREMGLAGRLTRRGSQHIHYCRPVGTHPAMAEVIAARAQETSRLNAAERGRGALVVIGHGTDRNATSADTLRAHVDRLRETADFSTVECGFLDEDPTIVEVVAATKADDLVLVPFFVADGWHTRTTIPADLGLSGELSRFDDRRIWYAPPVGTSERIPELILAIARDSGADLSAVSGKRDARPRQGPLSAARRAFREWLDASDDRSRRFLQITVRAVGADRFEVRHADDADLRLDLLRRSTTPDDAIGIARFTHSGAFRPLRTAADLQTGWALTDLDADGLWRTLDLLYPGCVLHWHRQRDGRSEVVSYREWAARQTGIYSEIQLLPPHRLPVVESACCAERACLRTRLWDGHAGLASAHADDAVPCREPCTLFASAARQVQLSAIRYRALTQPSPGGRGWREAPGEGWAT